jgi:hypothetical protein
MFEILDPPEGLEPLKNKWELKRKRMKGGLIDRD